jgi:paraquat-inducible protein A
LGLRFPTRNVNSADKKLKGMPKHELDSANEPLADASLVACPSCDLMQRLPELEPGEFARCPRCDTELRRRRKDSLQRTLALTLGAAVLVIIANTVPMLGLSAVGNESFTTIIGGARQLWRHDQQIVACMVFFSAVLAPGLQIGLLLVVLLGSLRERPAVWVGGLLRHLPFTRTWSMLEIMLLGVLVALTKIAEYATVIPGVALFAVGGLVVLIPAMQSSFDPQEIWDRIQWANGQASPAASTRRTREDKP